MKKLRRGWSTEADQLLSYLEGGVADALERNYLSSLILALSLDPAQPNDVIESYTFKWVL